MPVMNGLDSTRNIRLFDASVPIIAVTASVDASEKHICISAGMNDVLCQVSLLWQAVCLQQCARMFGPSSSTNEFVVIHNGYIDMHYGYIYLFGKHG